VRSAQASDELISDPLYPRLKQHVLGSTGLAYYEDKDTDLAQRITGRLACLGLRDCSGYLNMLCEPLRGPAELDALIAAITIGETYFFRHQEHFDSLRDLVLPGLAARNREHRSLRIWSAGCADGPEPYSLAILLKREMARQFSGWQTTILGTDINRHCLARAREGKFEEWAFRSTPEDVRHSCFQSDGKRWGILPEYREGVSFQYHNLVEHAFPSLVNNLRRFDLVVCRNVMIYFEADRMRKMILQFYDCLAPGGWLLVGPTEPNMTFFSSFRTVNAPGVTLYQKPEQTVPAPSPVLSAPVPLSHAAGARPAPCCSSGSIRPPKSNLDSASPRALSEVRRHADRGAWENAATCCEELLKKDPRNSQAHFYYGLILDQMQRGPDAERSLRRAIELDRQSVLPHYYLGLFLQSHSDLREAAPGGAARGEAARLFERVLELLNHRSDADVFADADGMTAAELKNLVKMHIETLGEHG
jgi:chemotaxis protein methyltransferase CheR